MTEKVSFIPEGETEAIDFYIVEQERLAGRNYLLVTDSEEGDGEALILRARPEETENESMYEIVDDDQEQTAVLLLMRDALEDLGIEIEV